MRKWRNMFCAARFLALAFLLLKSGTLLAAASIAVDLSQFPLDDPRALAARVKGSPLWGRDGSVAIAGWKKMKDLYRRGEQNLHVLVATNDVPAGVGLVPILYVLATAVQEGDFTPDICEKARSIIDSQLWRGDGVVRYLGQQGARSIRADTYAALAVAAGIPGGVPAVQAFHVLATEVLRLSEEQERREKTLAGLMVRAKHGLWFSRVRSAAQAFEAEQKRLAAEENARRKASIEEFIKRMKKYKKHTYERNLLELELVRRIEARKIRKRFLERRLNQLRGARLRKKILEDAVEAENERRRRSAEAARRLREKLENHQRQAESLAQERKKLEERFLAKGLTEANYHRQIELLDRRCSSLVDEARDLYAKKSTEYVEAVKKADRKQRDVDAAKATLAKARLVRRASTVGAEDLKESLDAAQQNAEFILAAVTPKGGASPKKAGKPNLVLTITPTSVGIGDAEGWVIDTPTPTLGSPNDGTLAKKFEFPDVSDAGVPASEGGGDSNPRAKAAKKTGCMPNPFKALWKRIKRRR